MENRVWEEEGSTRDVNHLGFLLFHRARRKLREEVKPDFVLWFNQASQATNSGARFFLGLLIVVLDVLAELLRQARSRCQ